jgi:O-antigen biosynthesis protein WbqP
MTMKGPKRAFDLVVAALMLAVASPVLLLAMAAIRASSPGPALFSQIRVGKNGALFRCHKLRTMYLGTPSLPSHEAPANSVTAVGKALRRFKIDELPQLWNVLKGEMSLVGPRPCLPAQSELIRRRKQLGVSSALPGITGLAQIRAVDMSDPKLCAETDAAYLETASIGFDLRILLGTIYPG